MIMRNDMDWNTNTASFSISSAADIANLPTMTEKGKNEAASYEACAPGSSAITTSGDLKLYMLDGASNEWKERS